MRTYCISSPYYVVRDQAHDLERSAILAGRIKNSYEELHEILASIARLTSVTAPQEEVRARELLNTVIDAKRAYAATEARRIVHHTYESENERGR